MRKQIEKLVEFGALPTESASVAEVARCQSLIESIAPPISLQEAVALVGILGSDDCFGLAWSIVHLIESAPGWGIEHIPPGSGFFLKTLRTRANNAQLASDSPVH